MFEHQARSVREAAFIHRNQDKWQRLEKNLDRMATLHGDEASALYIQLTDDLNYARTFYPSSNLPVYLNGLAVRLHHHMYRNQRVPRKRFLTFWTQEIPLTMAKVRRPLLLAFAVFIVAMFIGALSAHHDATFPRLIMGDAYVDRTLDNIAAGEPLAVYGSRDQGDMFLGITINNIRVAFLCFAAGLFAGWGAGLLLLYNGIMVGAFQYFFHQQGVLRESLLTIWVHGTLEISAIIIAGAAGLVLGRGFLFPETYSRGESFRLEARIGLKVVVGLVPVFILAGFLESFVTRHALVLPLPVTLLIIAGSIAFVVWYYIILPFHAEHRADTVPPSA
jgi:uncharacterized membrane protein SpoIIM required for sporulation